MRKIVAVRDLRAELGWPYSESQTWRMIKAGKFPQPFFLTDCRLALVYVDDVEAVIEAAAADKKRRAA